MSGARPPRVAKSHGLWHDAWKRLLRNRLAVLCLALTTVIFLGCVAHVITTRMLIGDEASAPAPVILERGGRYRFTVRSFVPGETGRFNFSFVARGGKPLGVDGPQGHPLPDLAVSGELSEQDPFIEVEPHQGGDRRSARAHYQRFHFTAPAGTEIRELTVSGRGFTPVLELSGDDGAPALVRIKAERVDGGPWLRQFDTQRIQYALNAPGAARDFKNPDAKSDLSFLCGTDGNGRDLFARVMLGGVVSFLFAISATVVSLVLGIAWGGIAGYYGGKLDDVMMRVVDVLYGIPFIFIVILVMTIASDFKLPEAGRYLILLLVIGAFSWMTLSRIVRGQVLSLREMDYVQAARACGAGNARIIFRHIVPNLLGPVIVYTTLTIPGVMLTEAFVSFLGLGISDPYCSWGTLASEGFRLLSPHEPKWWLITFPGALMAVTLFGLNFLGDGLRDALDPRMKR